MWQKSSLFLLSVAVACHGAFVASPSSYWNRSNKYTRVKSHASTEATHVEHCTLFPELPPNRNGTIAVDDVHTIFYQEYGLEAATSNDEVLTALFLHGGPGAGCSPNHARFMDPTKYRIVLMDQRGSGQSTPRGEVFKKNTLLHLVQDCERLRIELGIERWDLVLGGSWGSTLALAYAQEYPESVRSLVLRGVCLFRQCEVDWLASSRGGAASLDPEGWSNFSSAMGVNVDEATSDRAALHACYDRLLGDDPVARIYAARSWMRWEMRISSLARRNEQDNETISHEPVLVWSAKEGKWFYQDSQAHRIQDISPYESQMFRRGVSIGCEPFPVVTNTRPVSPVEIQSSGEVPPEEAARFIPAQAMATVFYSVNAQYAMDNIELLSNERLDRIRGIPCIAVQGGKDTICPPDTALDLHAAWPEMELRMPKGAGHSMYDAAITNELVQATNRLAVKFSGASGLA